MTLDEPEDGPGRTGAAIRWGAAGLLITGIHLGAAWWLASSSVLTPPPPDQAQGIPIDLAPTAQPQNAPSSRSTVASGPAPAPQAAAAPTPTGTPEPTAPEPPPDVAAPLQLSEAMPPQAEPAPEQQAQPMVEPAREPPPGTPSLPRQLTADAVPAPPSPPRRTTAPKPDARVLARGGAKRSVLAEKRARARAERTAARAAAPAEAVATRVQAGGGTASAGTTPASAASGTEMATWHGAIVAHIRRFQPSWNGASGTALVFLVVDNDGRVLSSGLARGSGDPQIDQAAIATVKQASPLPPPPPGAGRRFSFTIPFRFSSSARF